MHREQILNDMVNNPMYNDILDNIIGNDRNAEDIKADIWLMIFELKEEKLLEAYNKKYLKYLFIRIVTNQYKSSTSYVYKKYKKEKFDREYDIYNVDREEEEYDEGLDMENFIRDCKSLTYIERELLSIYYQLFSYRTVEKKKVSYRSIGKEYNISYVTVNNIINSAKKKLIESSKDITFED